MHLPTLRTLLFSSTLLLSLPFSPLASAESSSSSPTTTTTTTTVTLAIPASPPHLPNPHALPPSTHATLTKLLGFGGALSQQPPPPPPSAHHAPLTTANTFVFRNVTPGSYLADVHSATHGFAPLRVDVLFQGEGDDGALEVRAWETFRGNEWENKGEEVRLRSGAAGAGPVFPVRVLGRKVFFTERGSFSVFGILKNPMILMSLVSLGLFIGLPKLMENMDPEMRAEFEKQQQSNPMSSLMSGGQPSAGNFDVAGFLSGHSKEGAAGAGEPGSSTPSGSGSGSGSAKKGGRR
ncbi:hypothetical protein SLS62_010098 [Diatrype stigma]|uniref:ER membrane protein complex subunit 7 beta-sandwich domain-containing protein n=1 Tax=Diatrype stigma TaxID=117547 RepID=A0AAN9YI16_9PEZI